MTNKLNDIEKTIKEFNYEDLHLLQVKIKQQVLENQTFFEQSIRNGNIDNLTKYLYKVDFSDEYILHLSKTVIPHVNSLIYLKNNRSYDKKIQIKSNQTLLNYHSCFEKKHLLKNSYEFQKITQNENSLFSLNEILFANLLYRFIENFKYNEADHFNSLNFLRKEMLEKDEMFKNIMTIYFKCSFKKIDYQENSLLISSLLEIGYQENLIFEANNENNYYYIKKILNKDFLLNDEFMLKSLQSFHFLLIKDCFESRIDFFNTYSDLNKESKHKFNSLYKSAFSNLFLSKDTLHIQEYIIDNINDISVGDNIVLKTILNRIDNTSKLDNSILQKRIGLLIKTVDRYKEIDNDTLNFKTEIIKILSKRTNEHSGQIILKYINFLELNQKFPNKDGYVKNNKI